MVLAQLLEQSCHNTLLLPTASVTPEILERLGQDPGTILCISALPPFVFTQTRTLCQRIREQLPENRILIGLWQSAQSPELMRERFGSARPDRVVATLGDAMAQIEQWQQGCTVAGIRSHGLSLSLRSNDAANALTRRQWLTPPVQFYGQHFCGFCIGFCRTLRRG